jgi:hypothetical protein
MRSSSWRGRGCKCSHSHRNLALATPLCCPDRKIHTPMHTQTSTHARLPYTHKHKHTQHTCIHMHMWVNTHNTHAYIRVCESTHTTHMHTYAYVSQHIQHTCVHTHMYVWWDSAGQLRIQVNKHVYIQHKCIHWCKVAIWDSIMHTEEIKIDILEWMKAKFELFSLNEIHRESCATRGKSAVVGIEPLCI